MPLHKGIGRFAVRADNKAAACTIFDCLPGEPVPQGAECLCVFINFEVREAFSTWCDG
jgi:hypothetical protein